MTDFIAKYLDRNSRKDDDTTTASATGASDQTPFLPEEATHLIAIPMESCHELLIELESVQRAILYHCPILVDSCIVPTNTKLPMLYVQAMERNIESVTSMISDLVQLLATKHLFQEPDPEDENDQYFADELTADGIKPITLTFSTLEVDGKNNEVLHTVAKPNSKGMKQIQSFQIELRQRLDELGYRTMLPPDPHQAQGSAEFRPRIPFMKLPDEMNNNINNYKAEETELNDEDLEYLTSEEGGNGISPIFWCQWWDDTFGSNIRMREVGVYPRNRNAKALSQEIFYLPHEVVALPGASPSLLKGEDKFAKYQDQRMEEELKRLEPDAYPEENKSLKGSNPFDLNENPDLLMKKTRDRLEKIYIDSADEELKTSLEEEDVQEATEVTTEHKNAPEPPIDEEAVLTETAKRAESQKRASSDDFVDDWMKERIRKTIENRESERAKLREKKEMPPIEENPVFQKYKDGTLIPESKSPKKGKQLELGPYPSREHFAGIWRVISSPTGFPTEPEEASQSENIILRIDGTIAGGPILDAETRQKAAGGTWKMTEQEDGNVNLRIRLIIPPKKERILVMEGRVDRAALGTDIPMASKAFGIPELEERAKRATNRDMDDLLHCSGDVHVEDAITKSNREDIGTFSIMKISGPKAPNEYTITIPKPVRNQD